MEALRLSFDGGEQPALGRVACWIADLMRKFRLQGFGAAMPVRRVLRRAWSNV